ncbi:MAG: hypothetical protein A2W25_11930 [candidate division Zixibacteria bacterium RBG_16_53_22]|nr:MAG: hypothetical protein A2W25_11930 [candidate division Zixibacteria bacterium RBG_16_53_22]
MSWVFVGTLARLGSFKVIGPATGKQWIIRSSGDWIPEEDAEGLLKMEVEICCVKTLGKVMVRPLHRLVPTVDDMKKTPL